MNLTAAFQSVSHSAWHLFRLIRRRFDEVRVLQTAGSLTYTTLLSLVPMVTVILAVMRQFAPFLKLGEGMRGFLLQNLLPDKAGKVIATYALQFSEKASSLTVLGTLLLVATAVMLFQTIDHTFNSIWGVKRPRPHYIRIPVYWVALTVGPLLFAASVAVTSELLRASLGFIDEPGWLSQILDRTMTTFLLAALFAFLFHVVPNRRLQLRHSIIGGLVAGVCVVLVHRLFGFYLSKLPNITLIYGTFSVLPIFLVWVYLSWLAILFGASVAAVLPDFSLRRHQLPTTMAGRLVSSLRLVQALGAAQKGGRTESLQSLALASRQTVTQTDILLDELRRSRWVARTEDGEWILSVAAHTLLLGDLLAALSMGPEDRDVGELAGFPEDQRLLRETLGRMRQGLRQPVCAE